MMKRDNGGILRRAMAWGLALVLALSAAACAEEIDWGVRYRFAELEAQLRQMNEACPEMSRLYPIGRSWQERAIWCMEISNFDVPREQKTGIAVLANIHGGERESATCAMYFADWLTANAQTEAVRDILDAYTIYVVPVINPDGYEQSFVINTRQNLRPVDGNGDGVAFSDPYSDLDGDGAIATLYRGTAEVQPDRSAIFGMESPDWDGNGVLGDDPRNSGIDLNRTFDYQWNRFDVETVDSADGVIGTDAFSRAGSSAASEPEVQAVQNFLLNNDIDALATLHTGIQCVLYPWCYRPYDPETDSADIPYMKDVAAQMAAAFQETTGRGFYTKSSYEDYPTAAELIDYAYGRLNIKAYTIEVYDGGRSESGELSECKWEDDLPEAVWKFYSQQELAEMGLDPAKITDRDGNALAGDEGLWFYTSASAQRTNAAPEDQELMAQGCRDALLVMLRSEPYGQGYTKPEYLNWN